MLIELLDQTHDDYDAPLWAKLVALYKGGRTFEKMIEKFLLQNPGEPPDLYAQRKREAHYRSYLSPIADYFVAYLFAGGCDVKSKENRTGYSTEADPYYARFRDDVGGDKSLAEFMKERTTEALIKQSSHWLIKLPRDASTPPAEMLDGLAVKGALGEATLVPVDREQLLDFEIDDLGKLLWCVVHEKKKIRPSFHAGKRNQWKEVWTYYDRTYAERYVVVYEEGKRPTEGTNIAIESRWEHGCLEVPLVTLCVDPGMWIAERLRSAQVEHFRMSAGLAWAIRRTCYAMPVIKRSSKEAPTLGTGYWLHLDENDKFEWSSPDGSSYDVISRQVAEQRDEIYRTAHQMAQGMDNNAETVGRSADSKDIDQAATRIILNAYGQLVAKAIEETFEILSDARGDRDTSWDVTGFSGYDTTSAGSLVANATQAQLLGIPSKTFRREMKTKVAMALMPEADQQTKDAVRNEIYAATESMADPSELEFDATHEVKKMAIEAKSKTDTEKNEIAMKVASKPVPKNDRSAGASGGKRPQQNARGAK